MLEFKDVTLGYADNIVISSLSFKVEKSDFWGIAGPNGTGKTTLLKAILGIIKPLRGEIVKKENLRFGYVPQKENLDDLYPFSVRDMVKMALYSSGGFMKKIEPKTVDEALEKLDIGEIASKLYRDISGGQKQRTLIARALASKPDILILDEPTNGMDIKSEYLIMELIRDLNNAGITVIMVTHLLSLIARYSQRGIVLNGDISIGDTQNLITSENLSALYDIPINVTDDPVAGKMVWAKKGDK